MVYKVDLKFTKPNLTLKLKDYIIQMMMFTLPAAKDNQTILERDFLHA